ncbi:MAG: hypothetical protein MUE73_16450 [Planctomycetes bacterium]|nr:hypothetical protein [Planctomycetota bacterium]
MRPVILACLLLASARAAAAGEESAEPAFEVTLAPVFWLPRFSGAVVATGDRERVRGEFGAAVLARVEAFRSSFGGRYEQGWLLLGTDDSDGRTRMNYTRLAGAARLDLGGGTRLLPSAGFRYLAAWNEIESGGADSRRRWLEPWAGVAAEIPLVGGLSLRLEAAASGFGLGSRLCTELEAALSLRIAEGWTLDAGFRRITCDVPRGRFALDARAAGPFAGLTLRF